MDTSNCYCSLAVMPTQALPLELPHFSDQTHVTIEVVMAQALAL